MIKGAEVMLADDLLWRHTGRDLDMVVTDDGKLIISNYGQRKDHPDFVGTVFMAPAGQWKWANILVDDDKPSFMPRPDV